MAEQWWHVEVDVAVDDSTDGIALLDEITARIRSVVERVPSTTIYTTPLILPPDESDEPEPSGGWVEVEESAAEEAGWVDVTGDEW